MALEIIRKVRLSIQAAGGGLGGFAGRAWLLIADQAVPIGCLNGLCSAFPRHFAGKGFGVKMYRDAHTQEIPACLTKCMYNLHAHESSAGVESISSCKDNV